MKLLGVLSIVAYSNAVLAAGLAVGETAAPATDTLAAIVCVPADADVVAYLDLQSAMRNAFVVQLFNKYVDEKDKKRLGAFEDSLGLNAKEDITALAAFGSALAPDRLTVGAVGRFRPDRMIARAATAEGYASLTVDGESVHCLGSGEKRYVAFPREGLLLLGNDLPALRKGIAASRATDPTFRTLASKNMDRQEGRTALGWLYARNPEMRLFPLPGILGQGVADYLTCTAFEEGDGLTLEGRARVHDAGQTEQVISELEGLIAVTRLAGRDSEWARALSDVRVTPGADRNTVHVRVHEGRSVLESILAKGKKRHSKGRREGAASDGATSPSAPASQESGSLDDAVRDLDRKR